MAIPDGVNLGTLTREIVSNASWFCADDFHLIRYGLTMLSESWLILRHMANSSDSYQGCAAS